MKLARGPVRPGIRYGVEQEGPNKGVTTVVLLGAVPWARASAAVAAKRPGHVFWEWADHQSSWTSVRRLLRRVTYVTVEVDLSDVARLPPRLPRRVTVMVRVPKAWLKVTALKVNHGHFRVSHVGWEWRLAVPSDYRGDEVLWPE